MAITVKARVQNNVPGVLSRITSQLLSSGLKFQSSETLENTEKDFSELHVVITGDCDDPTLLGKSLSAIPGVDSILEIHQPDSEITVNGAMFMAFFGLGTLPTVLSAGILAHWVARLSQMPQLRRGAGIFIILLAVLTLVASTSTDHAHFFHYFHLN